MKHKHCSVEGCEKKHSGIGFCKYHYNHFKRHGDPLITWRSEVRYKKIFMQKIKIIGDCWERTALLDADGYGRFFCLGKLMLAHRYSYLIHKGDIGNLFVCHKCDNRKCVNPDHLFLGTNQDNMDDKKRKGRNTKGSGFSHAVMVEQDVVIMRALRNLGFTYSAIAKRFKTSETTAHSAINRRTWKHVA